MHSSPLTIKTLVVACGLIMASCSEQTGNTPGTNLSGTAAAGAAIIGQVTVKGSLGNSRSAIIEANGNYNVDVTGLTAPYRLRAEGTVGGRLYKLHSYAEASDVGGTVNITPFTDLIIANVARDIAANYFDHAAPLDLDPVEIDAQETALQAKLQNVFTALGVDSAINLLNSSFSANHSGLDAALDAVRIEPGIVANQYTIRNLVENTTITDDVTDPSETETLTVNDPTTLSASMSDTQQIVAKFDAFAARFTNGLPTATSIENFFSTDFYQDDQPRALWLTDITTDPGVIGVEFNSIVVSDLDSVAGTAKVTFNVGFDGVTEPEPETWLVAKDATHGWQLRGNQLPVDYWFNFHCNDSSGTGTGAGACGVNTMLIDNDFGNNGTGGVTFASATLKIIDGTDATEKGVIYLGTPPNNQGGTAGELQIYNAGNGYQGDWKGFGSTTADINPATFAVGDTLQYNLFVEDLDIANPNSPAIAGGATSANSFTNTVLFAPSTVARYPNATTATRTAIQNFTLGNNLTVAWTLQAGTHSDEVLVQISDALNNKIEIWDESFAATAVSTTVASTSLDASAATAAGLDPTAATYNLLVRIYAVDDVTGQNHSRDYFNTIPGPQAPDVVVNPPSTLTCVTESGWNDAADNGLGAPITPYSYADYLAVVADCGGGFNITRSQIAGLTFDDSGETSTFNDTGALATAADPETGSFIDGGSTVNFEWYIENGYIVVYSDSSIDSQFAVADAGSPLSLRETSRLIAITSDVYTFINYSEQSNYGDMVRSTGTDGEIWNVSKALQP